MNSSKNPIAAFLEWYRSMPVAHRQYLAHLYTVLTTQNSTDIVMAQEMSQERFELHVIKPDFPVRMVAKMMLVRSIIDFIFINKDQLDQNSSHVPPFASISDKQWEKGLESWKRLRQVELSDFYTSLWLKSELAKENRTEK